MRNMTWKMTVAVCAIVALAGCNPKGSTVQDMVGLSTTGPDEFNVVSRPPLSVPPEFDLTPPAPLGTPNTNEIQPADAAHALVTGKDAAAMNASLGAVNSAVIGVSTNRLNSNAEQRFLEKFGANKADNRIREMLAQEAIAPVDDSSWLDGVLPGRKKDKDTLDPTKETETLRNGALKEEVKAPPATMLQKTSKK